MSDLIEGGNAAGVVANSADSSMSLSPHSAANNAGSASTTNVNVQVADINSFVNYLKSLLPILLDATPASMSEFDKTVTEKSSIECLKKFLGDSQVRTLMVQKFIIKDEEEGEQVGSDDAGSIQFIVSTEVHYTNPKCQSVQLIKRGAVIEGDKKFQNQLRVISLTDSSPYETLHSYVSNTVAPYFKSYIKRSADPLKAGMIDAVGGGRAGAGDAGSGGLVNGTSSGGSGGAGDQFASLMEKRIAEIEMGFLHLQQNIEIPEINIAVHPVIIQMIKKCTEENRKPKADDFTDKIEDSNFLNQLHSGVTRWVREIKKVTKLDRDPSTGTALQEISFWQNLERALNRILEKRESIEVTLTLDILRLGKRFIATVSFDSDTGLKEALETAKDYNLLMKDFPLNELMSAVDLAKIAMAVTSIFNHLKKIRSSKYPINRTLKLIEAISKDLTTQLLKVLSTQRLMIISFDDFEKTIKSCTAVFTVWDDEYEKLQSTLRDLAKRKRDEYKMVWRINPSHKKLQNRLILMQNFRRQHEQLRLVITRVLRPAAINSQDPAGDEAPSANTPRNGETTANGSGLDVADANAIEEVSLAYEKVKEVDALDISEEGQELWESAMRRYDERIERVEARMTARLRDQLGTAKNANEMFRIFSRFNALFVRPHIRGAIREYQTQLIQRVKDDIEALQEKFKAQYIHSKCYRMSKIRDIPPVAGSIIWAKQIERQLNMYMGRVEAVLGKGWETHVDGQKLKADGDSFRMKLNTQELFEDWSRKVNQKNLQNSGRIFLVDNIRASKGTIYTLKVSFSPEIITLTKEARNMKWLVSRVPLAIVNKAHTARQMYPYAISLIENVSTYKRICERVSEKRTCQLLVAGMKKDIQNLIMDMSNLVWDSYKLESSVQKFSDSIYNFREKVDELISVENTIEHQLKELDSCVYNEQKYADILYEIQKSIDYLNLKGFSNLPQWVARLDEEVEKKLAQRLNVSIRSWIDVLLDKKNKNEDEDSTVVRKRGGNSGATGAASINGTIDSFEQLNIDDSSLSGITIIDGTGTGSGVSIGIDSLGPAALSASEPKIKRIVLEILIKNQVLYVNPSIEDAREHLIAQLYEYCSIITTQKRIQHSRYQVTMEAESEYKITYKNLLNKFTNGVRLLEYAFGAIDNLLKKAQDYVKIWLHFQSLWDLQPDTLYGKLSANLNLWIACLNEMKESRKSFDTQETQRLFGPICIDYTKVQSKVNVKYDAWHKEVLSKFGQLLGNELQDFHSHVSKSRSDLESQSVEASSTSEAVSVITYVQSLKRKLKDWERKVDQYTNAQKILERQRYQFPSNWLYTDYIQGEWGAFNEILKRKDLSIQNQVASLQAKIISEEKIVENKTTELVHEWEASKPVTGTLKPDQALKSLQIFETKLNRIKEERDNMLKAKDALELRDTVASANDVRISVSMEELNDLKGVWTELSKIWIQIDEQKEKQWLTVQPRKLRTILDNLLNQLKDMPSRLRQYESYNHVKKLLQDYLKANLLIVELKSEALKDRHWKQLMKRMNVVWNLNDLTLGHVWDINLLSYETIIKDVLMVAQGEKALEEFLKQVSELWKNYSLELVNYQNKCQIIRGWDDLFNKLKEHINSVSAMKLSPYYKEFEEEALAWEDKLNRINAVFDVWIDVQRRWVYLDGIFGGSADIKHLLPNETQKFQNVSSEFLTLMKKVSKSPLVLDILNIQGLQKLLERLADLLAKIQKALGEYLERERSSFPRFYFVGDEDLLEIIGNTKNIPRLQKHFKKMFAGVHSIQLSEDNTQVLGVSSKEGEEITFKNVVSIAENPKINDWLTLVEREIRFTLASLLNASVQESNKFRAGSVERDQYLAWAERYPAQLVVLSAQISWSESVENALKQIEANPTLASAGADSNPLEAVLRNVEHTLKILADSVLQDQQPIRRRKLEHLIIEHVHQRDVIRHLVAKKVTTSKSFEWLSQMRFYFDPKCTNVLKQLSIQMANAKFNYGFEYLGVQDKLVQTPLTDRCYLTMTQALEARLGGSPFGPAGTGKTESVKALGHQLGQFVLVFNCDETFDFQAMGRIFVGLCQVGAWGCFDEFNRLEERMLSAVSQQIQTIQEALKEQQQAMNQQGDQSSSSAAQASKKGIQIELVGKQVTVNPLMAIFITMNPGYAGRSNLPDNLKKLFRSLAMTQPDNVLIAQVMLYSQGFRTAEKLAHKIVPFFKLCNEQLSSQSHYDFGLRSLKSVLVMAGNVKRERIQRIREAAIAANQPVDEGKIAEDLNEQEILIQSIMESFVPRLISDDLPLLLSLLNDVFPGVKYEPIEIARLKEEIKRVCEELHLVYGGTSGQESSGSLWLEKVLQLYSISNLNHGLMMVGPSGSGKSAAWRVLLKALERYEGVEGVAHVIDPKAISKDALYGSMDPNTREWTDGLFTHILRKIIDNVRGELNKRQWIIFDGDVDPEWVENLNSVLDDNKLLTLPNGERLNIPPNVRIMFEVQDLRYATLATVSRCGMIWFSEHVLTLDMIYENYFSRLCNVPLEGGDDDDVSLAIAAANNELKLKRSLSNPSTPTATSMGFALGADGAKNTASEAVSGVLADQRMAAAHLRPFFTLDGLVTKSLEFAAKFEHIMDFTRLRALGSMFTMLNQAVRNVVIYNQQHDFRLNDDQIEKYVTKSLVLAILWSFSGDCKLKYRCELGDFIRASTTLQMPTPGGSAAQQSPVIDFEVGLTTGEWSSWLSKVPQIEVETHKVAAPDVVVPTIDTIRHESLLFTWLSEHKPLLLCGPPGSGKTMTLFAALRSLPDLEVVGLNFSSATTPELMMKTFDHYCEYKRTPNGIVLSPIQLGKWLVIFCDEINLPDEDKYGTQRVISFIRQCIEHGGFYRASDQSWIKLERIQFVGACNPPTDPGRKPLSHRFLRHVPLVYVDYPGELSLKQIYGTFNRAMLRMIPSLRAYAEPLTNAMVEFYLMSQERFTVDQQPHYIYSPREMTRWVRGICEAIRPLESMAVEDLVRLYVHEALRLFQDRLVTDEERRWTDDNINMVAAKHFSNMNQEKALKRPILYSNWLKKDYLPVEQEELREYVKARLKVFYEEELDVPLVLFNEVLDHVLRIDRIFRQPQGHLLLIGVSGAGKTTLSRFVAWINGLSVFQIKVHNNYSSEDFDDDLRNVLRRSGTKGEKIVFILDESNVLDSGFLERMNTLLANGEVPGLFEGDEYATLMTQCKEGAQRDGLMLDSAEELYKWFTNEVMRNLHVVFTMNPSQDGLKNRAATSPALFNRCVLNWFGDWSNHAYFQVGKEFTFKIDLEKADYIVPDNFRIMYDGSESHGSSVSHREAVVNSFVQIHDTLHQANHRLVKKGVRTTTITPRHYLDFINHFAKLYNEKRSELEDQQVHLNIGLAKIRETVEQVEELQKSLAVKRTELEKKNNEANIKLKQMMNDQQEAEKKKVASQELQQILNEQLAEIEKKRTAVMDDLSKVEPAVLEAQNAVKSIKKNHLVELRAMANPPAAVKLGLESICLILNQETSDWKVIRSIIIKETFISTIINFQTDNITPSIKEKMKTRFLNNPDYDFAKVNNASQACGPLVKWATAQIQYAEMLHKVEPLRDEMKSLEEENKQNIIKAQNLEAVINQLEKSIAQYKMEYAELISQAQIIKSDLNSVESKVERSVALLKSLSNEQTRWESSSEQFKVQMATIVGDCVLSSAFMAYAGYYDQAMRNTLFNTWISHLQNANIKFKEDLARIEYLSNADERMNWNASALPTDDLCIENAIMLKRFNRYPLIIDPSGQATEFIMNMYKDRKITKTSFLDNSFRKNLESALRFGNPILIQDVENYDPILNPVLNREIRRTGGRVLITLGDQDIDFSPMFTMFLSTRDPSVEFPPDICSRVTFVNFTVTRASLQAQCLHQVLKCERPDVEEKRLDLLKMQGEFQQRLRHLEKDLLRSLNESKGKILNDDTIITRLENLKKEAAEISRKVAETDQIMKEVEMVINQYLALSQSCSSIYFTMEALNQIHSLYQYSLQYFLEIFNTVLAQNVNLKEVKDPQQRLKIIAKDLFYLAFYRLARGMLHDDRIVLALLFSRIYIKGFTGSSAVEIKLLEDDFRSLMSSYTTGLLGKESSGGVHASSDQISALNSQQNEALLHLSKMPAFKSLKSQLVSGNNAEILRWLESTNPETGVPELIAANFESQQASSANIAQIGATIKKLLLIKAFRPDRFISMAQIFVNTVFGEEFLQQPEKMLDLAHIVENEIKATTPILMCSVSGYDASGRVEDLAVETNKQLVAIAIGSSEGFTQAEKAINNSSKTGRWVLLKNVHLAPQWLVQLEKKLHNLQAHPSFRIFLSMEINPRIPSNLLRLGRAFVFEPPPGIRANLMRTLSVIPATRMNKAPAERSRLYFLLSWLHATAQERLRYVPLGWSKTYEFNESDLRCALDTIDVWIDTVAMGRTNLPPNKVPFDAIFTLMSECVYGGKIDNSFDSRLLNTFLKQLFNVHSFENDYKLVTDEAFGLSMPDAVRREQFCDWVENLKQQQTPSWLGLPNSAENILLSNYCTEIVSKLLKLSILDDEEEELAYEAEADSSAAAAAEKGEVRGGRPLWMRQLHQSVSDWLKLLPKQLSPIKRTQENIKDPLFRFFEREINTGIALLKKVIHDLNDIEFICQGTKKQNNYHRQLLKDLAKGQIPQSWKRYTLPKNLIVQPWIVDFAERIKQMSQISKQFAEQGSSSLKSSVVWLGGLFTPEAYITATRQYVAQANSWSLEELALQITVYDNIKDAKLDECSFSLTGLKLQGAACVNNRIKLSTNIANDFPVAVIRWNKEQGGASSSLKKINLPVYLNATRAELLFTLNMETEQNENLFYTRGVAILASNLN